jgi:hypothetical protein
MKKSRVRYIVWPIAIIAYWYLGHWIREMVDWLNTFHSVPSVLLDISGWVLIIILLALGYRFMKPFFVDNKIVNDKK